MREKLQTWFVFLFSVSLLPYIGLVVIGKIDFLINDLTYTDFQFSIIESATIVTYINVACLLALAIYTLSWSNERPDLLISALFFLLRIPWLLNLFRSIGISLQIVSDVFTFGFILFLMLHSYLKPLPRYVKKLNGFTLLSGWFNCSIGIFSGIYFTVNPVNYSILIRKALIIADIHSWIIFGTLLCVNMCIVHIVTVKRIKIENFLLLNS